MVRLWDIATENCRHVFSGHGGRCFSIAYSPNGNRIASESESGQVYLLGVESGNRLPTLDGHTKAIRSILYLP